MTIVLGAGLLATVAFSSEIDPAIYGFSPDAPAATNALALQKALDGGHRTVRVTKPGVYKLDRPVYLDDATDLSFGADIVLCKACGYSNVLVNRAAWFGGTNSDITVRGLHIRANGYDAFPSLESKAAGLRGHFSFYHARRIRVFDYRILDLNGGQYALQAADFDDLIVDGFEVRGRKDGIHINAGKRFVIRNGIICTGDDGVALNANDWPTSAPCVGTIEDGVVENIVDMPGGRCNFARILTGAVPEWHAGIVLQRGEPVRVGQNVYFVYMPVGTNTYVSTVAPTHTQGTWTDPSGTTFLYAQSDGCRTSSIRNVTFRNITLHSKRGFDCCWDLGAWARSMHPEVPEADMPVTQISIDGLDYDGRGYAVRGNSSCDVILRGVRHPGDISLVSLSGYPGRDTHSRILLADSTFDRPGVSLAFTGPRTSAQVMVGGCLPDSPVKVVSLKGAKVSAAGQAETEVR